MKPALGHLLGLLYVLEPGLCSLAVACLSFVVAGGLRDLLIQADAEASAPLTKGAEQSATQT